MRYKALSIRNGSYPHFAHGYYDDYDLEISYRYEVSIPFSDSLAYNTRLSA